VLTIVLFLFIVIIPHLVVQHWPQKRLEVSVEQA